MFDFLPLRCSMVAIIMIIMQKFGKNTTQIVQILVLQDRKVHCFVMCAPGVKSV